MRCLGGRLTLVAIPAEELAVGESIHVGANGVINAPLLGQLQPVLLDGHLAPGRVADLPLFMAVSSSLLASLGRAPPGSNLRRFTELAIVQDCDSWPAK